MIPKLQSQREIWKLIEKEYEVSKNAFGRKISFVKEPYKRRVIFRDVGHAYMLSQIGFDKSALILAGSVIEELLRLYLKSRNLKPAKNSYNEYIKSCVDNGLLKGAVNSLTDAVRLFRNIVHIENENSKHESISKANAMGAVSSIFTIANDFRRI